MARDIRRFHLGLMKVVLASVGTRGDMEPFLAIGERLRERGEEVICAFPEQFRGLAEESGFEFASLGARFIELLDSDIGRVALGGGGSKLSKFVATVRLAGRQGDANRELVQRQRDVIEGAAPDRIVYNGKAIYPILWELRHPGRAILVSPVPYLHYVEGHPHLAFHRDLGRVVNRLTYVLADFGLAVTARISAKWLEHTPRPGWADVWKAIGERRVIYTVSPTLFPRPAGWDDRIRVLGYVDRRSVPDWQPDDALRAFLDRHDQVLFITFGSMTNPEPERRSQEVLEALVRHRIPAIINTAAGGLVRPGSFDPELVHFVSEARYDRLFPLVHGVVHHGGSGTTHLGLRSGCATLIVPHILDQFVWSRIVEEIGAGPAGVEIGDLTAERLGPKMAALLRNPDYRRTAREIARRMATEDFEEELYRTIVDPRS
jgi:sterol 3beta-glucosyltransferase